MRKALALSLVSLSISTMGLALIFAQGGGEQASQRPIDTQGALLHTEAGVLGPPIEYIPAYSESIPEVSAAQRDAFKRMDIRRQRGYDALNALLEPNPDHPVEGPTYHIMANGQLGTDESKLEEALADSSLTFFQSSDVQTALFPGSSVINEPAHAQIGKNVFFTGNWYVAKSTNAGATFSYVSPFADFPDFCCDQDVIHDVSRNLIIWSRQGDVNSAGVNQIKLGVSKNGGATFFIYTWSPTTFDSSLTNKNFDYPHLALSNDYLYITVNIFNAADIETNRMMIRLPLQQLAAGTFSFNRLTLVSGKSIEPVQGATTTMYFGSNENSAGTFRVYSWPESTTVVSSFARTIPAYTFTTKGSATCTVPNGRNPCGRTDDRITDGYVAKGIIGFFWNVAQGGGFPYPYINAATFRESDLIYLARPYISSSSNAYQYGAAAPNTRGDLGVAALAAGGSVGYPQFAISLADDVSGTVPPWKFFTVAASTNWGLNNDGTEGAGDYLRARQFSPVGTFWTASGYYGVGSPVAYKGRFAVFGRGREQPAWNRWSTQ